ncbi:MAG: hypothetical protein H0X62_03575 [Bacteroidetes bacterium]|nr:hypothetical protein [Bacteroidota bacterium]
MSIFSKIFDKKELNPADTGITFGRFTGLSKNEEQVEQWEKAISLYRKKDYTASIDALLNYLVRPQGNNVSITKTGKEIQFEINQGSILIEGSVNGGKIKAEAKIFEFEKPKNPLMRKLLEMNLALQYSFFSMKDQAIYLKLDGEISDASPDKLYYALKEIATTSDKQDDLLSAEFQSLRLIGTSHILPISGLEKEIKYRFFKEWIQNTQKEVSEIGEQQGQAATLYLYFSLIYKIDYLLKPEGNLRNELEKINDNYLESDDITVDLKNQATKESFDRLLGIPKEEVIKDFYNIKTTFGIANPATFQMIADFVYAETEKIKWFRDNSLPKIEIAAYQYISGYCFYNFGMYEPCVKLLHLLMQIFNPDFFEEMGFKEEYYNLKTGAFGQEAIEEEIIQIMKEGRKRFPHLMFLVANLRYDSQGDFCDSFFKEFDFLNFTDALY